MPETITGLFDTRRDAEMAVERLVQEYGLDRSRVTANAAGAANSAGTVVSGADVDASTGTPSEAAKGGRIVVTAMVEGDMRQHALDAFRDCGAAAIAAG